MTTMEGSVSVTPETQASVATPAPASPAPETVTTAPAQEAAASEPTETLSRSEIDQPLVSTPEVVNQNRTLAEKINDIAKKNLVGVKRGPDGKFLKADGTPAEAPSPGTDPAAPETPAVEPAKAYEPNFEYQVRKQKHEIPEYLRQSIQTPDQEKEIKTIFSKSHGFDIIQPRYKALTEDHGKLSGEVQQFQQSVAEIRSDFQRGDFDSLFQRLNIPEEKILQWVYDKVQFEQLPEDQKRLVASQKHSEREAWTAKQHAATLQRQQEDAQTQALGQAFEAVLTRPDVTSLSAEYDAQREPGAFRQLMVDIGEQAYFSSGQKVVLTPDQALEKALYMLGRPASPATTPPAATAAPAQAPVSPPVVPSTPAPRQAPIAAAATPAQPAVIPNIQGRSTSALKPKITSLAQLKEHAKNMAAGQ